MIEQTGIFLCENPSAIARAYGEAVVNRLPVSEQVHTKQDILDCPAKFKNIEYLFSTWGFPKFTEEEIHALLPSLKAVFYAAGSVQYFAKSFLACGVRVFSAWRANAVPVAEFTLAQILLANKGFYSLSELYSSGQAERAEQRKPFYPGNYEVKVGIIGAGMIGRMVMDLLRPFHIQILVYDAFLSAEQIQAMGARKAALEEIFAQCSVISNHLADNAQTKGMLHYGLFSQMQPYATFLNTGRGGQVVEADLARALTERPDLTALLDVTVEEPLACGHPFYSLPNCRLTPHIAGSMNREIKRMGAFMEAAYRAVLTQMASPCEVTSDMLDTMA